MIRSVRACIAGAAWEASAICYTSSLPGSDWLEARLVSLARWLGRWSR